MMVMMMNYTWKDTSTSNSLTMINLMVFLLVATLQQASVDAKVCDFEHGLGTNLCPWYNTGRVDDYNWAVHYSRTFGRYLYSQTIYSSPGKALLVGNYRNDSLVCFSFSYYMYRSYNETMNTYQEYFYNGYSPLLWSLSGDQGTKWKKGQVTVNFTMGLSRLIVEAILRQYNNFVALDNLTFSPGSCDTIPKVAIPRNAFDCSIGSFFSFQSKKCEKCPILPINHMQIKLVVLPVMMVKVPSMLVK
ncbi:MAM and LDL-receptor class A domain-containing protein 1-like isoform X4 [Xenia sp. Carnegie-2017]|uniref:MAM and LDL-receptor class A domain-containing protein 1-like isoform X4 n=1 Tax=Xenia sp. Carnegie-2017 TaxID=2897299 RepID=UPI001F04018F|nr:MAM and LDL-receptor class A domain-containing protein 1-like isoform X4 [Xenia sp. Carnegie-2017]